MLSAEDMARLHGAGFAATGRGWSVAEFRALLDNEHVFCCGGTRAFALGRAVADEAEILTITTDPQHRRQGLARRVLVDFEAMARHRGAKRIFLEVAADNRTAIALYLAHNYEETGRRVGYYSRSGGVGVDACVLGKVLA